MLTGQTLPSPPPLLPSSDLAALLKESWFLFSFIFPSVLSSFARNPHSGVFSAMSGSDFCSGELGVPSAHIQGTHQAVSVGKTSKEPARAPGL